MNLIQKFTKISQSRTNWKSDICAAEVRPLLSLQAASR